MAVQVNSAIDYTDNDVNIIVTGIYTNIPGGDAGNLIWTIASDFSSLKTLLPNILTCNMTYPDGKDTRIGTKRDLTFEGGGGAITTEELTEIDDNRYAGRYIQLKGLPVTNYTVSFNVMSEPNTALRWMINYIDTASDKKTLATQVQSFFEGACTQLNTVLEG